MILEWIWFNFAIRKFSFEHVHVAISTCTSPSTTKLYWTIGYGANTLPIGLDDYELYSLPSVVSCHKIARDEPCENFLAPDFAAKNYDRKFWRDRIRQNRTLIKHSQKKHNNIKPLIYCS